MKNLPSQDKDRREDDDRIAKLAEAYQSIVEANRKKAVESWSQFLGIIAVISAFFTWTVSMYLNPIVARLDKIEEAESQAARERSDHASRIMKIETEVEWMKKGKK